MQGTCSRPSSRPSPTKQHSPSFPFPTTLLMRRSVNSKKKAGRSSTASMQNSQSNSEDEDGRSEASYATNDSLGSHLSIDQSVAMSRGSSRASTREDSLLTKEVPDDVLIKAFEDLEEKRTSVREIALHQIIKSLSNRYMHDPVERNLSVWLDPVKRAVRREGFEGILANKGSLPQFHEEVVKILQDIILNGSSENKAYSIVTLAIITLIENEGDTATWEILDYLEDLFSIPDDDANMIHASLEAYGLLYTSTTTRPEQEGYNRILDAHLELLNSDDVDVRIAAGENIAIIIENRMMMTDEEDTPKTEPYYESLNELLQQLRFLSQDSQRHRAKKERTTQKSSFRDILQTVEKNVAPVIKLKIKQETIECDTWAKIKKLNSLRDAIGEGFTVHLGENQIVQDILHLSFDSASSSNITSTDRRLFQSIVDKARTKALKEMRGNRSSIKSGTNH
ncbi:hypothetical protein BASA60_009020 [Batrachochytrium salamandrivorans]|nr:hypothetical protein BASA60_009020 [Batrachochytrium salamandrivorans]